MEKSDITLEQARGTVDRVAQELGLLVGETSGFVKVQGPGNKHRVYIQKSRTLGRVETTLVLAADDPAYRPLPEPNGSISCRIAPDLVQLERVLRMLSDGSIATQVPNKPRPFAATKAPPARRPKAVAPPLPAASAKEELSGPDKELADRLALLKARAREAKINNVLENPEKYGPMSYDEAAAAVDGKVKLSALAEAYANSRNAEVLEVAAEAGIEFAQ